MSQLEYGTVVAMSDAFAPVSGFPLMHFPLIVVAAAFRPSIATVFFYRLHTHRTHTTQTTVST